MSEFLKSLVLIVAGGAAAYYGTLVVVLVVFAVRDEFRATRRRMDAVITDPRRYCLVGHLHDSHLDAEWCEAAHGAGDL